MGEGDDPVDGGLDGDLTRALEREWTEELDVDVAPGPVHESHRGVESHVRDRRAHAIRLDDDLGGPYPPQQLVVYAHIKSITAKGGSFEAKVDPAEYLSGETANRAAIADKVLQPGDTVPNDHYVRDESHRLLVYKIPANAHVTVITTGLHATRIPVSELAQIVAGKNPKHRSLFEPKNPFWIRVASDTALALDQQYSP